jgi:hypothetical protein
MSKVFSKPLLPLGQTKEDIITVYEYMKNKHVLHSFKLPDLKGIAKYYKLPVSGKKKEVFDRIEGYFLKIWSLIKIQRTFRGYLVRLNFRLRGEGYRERVLCVNDNDFYSLEPLKEIPFEYFYTFRCGKFIYGCNIISLIHLIKIKPVNPYNRENISQETIQSIVRLYNNIKLVFGLPSDAPVIKVNSKRNLDRPNGPISNEIFETRRNTLRTLRLKTMSERINEIFMEIDQLGNYTQSQWFSTLDRREYIQLFRMLYEIWMYRGRLTREIKMYICILADPFQAVYRERIAFHEASIEVIRDLCLKVMEYMVYCGIDDEYRKIGALHVLTALTYVSLGARSSLPWLYETLL